ncbi:polysaccharide pyruvyl transferase family protein [Microbacterium sp. NPDC056234]|uniref:polysaccharide pyruvyl transferase family protein n=1 Tax=Microbacterium sp. NPDC056234 TaxID=3345757 RepID=UPI0035E30073
MRVLVAWANDVTMNLGVRALGQGSEDLLRTLWPDAEFVFMNYGQRPAEVPWGRPRSLLRERVTGRLGMMRWFRDFDLVWDTRSGDSFADIYGLPRHTIMSMVHEFAAQADVPIVLAPQTIGPFGTVRGSAVARRSLRRSALAFARDPLSAEAAERLGRPVDATTSDLVFGIAQPEPGLPRDVLLNISGLLWEPNPHVDAETYRENVRRVIDGLLADGREVTLLPHLLDSPGPDNDVPVSHRLVHEYAGRIDIHVPRDLDDARSAISTAQLVIGARMHACLNALSTGTPAVAMAYSRKFAPLMESVGWHRVVSLSGSEDVAGDVLTHTRAGGLAEQAIAAKHRGRAMLDPVTSRLSEML